jgi:hypothetical protein
MREREITLCLPAACMGCLRYLFDVGKGFNEVARCIDDVFASSSYADDVAARDSFSSQA